LLKQLESGSSGVSREDIERQLTQVDTALELLERLDGSQDHKEP